MRLDKWLKVSRLIKRRTVANEACDNQRVTANGRPVKASYDVKADPEEALNRATDKFIGRFRRVEAQAAAQDKPMEDMDLDELDALWERAKET